RTRLRGGYTCSVRRQFVAIWIHTAREQELANPHRQRILQGIFRRSGFAGAVQSPAGRPCDQSCDVRNALWSRILKPELSRCFEREGGGSRPLTVWTKLMAGRLFFAFIPLLTKEGQRRSAGVVCSELRSHLIDIREALLINRCASRISMRSALRADFEQTAPALATPGHPRLP